MSNFYVPHLMIDLQGCDPTVMTDLNALYSFLLELPHVIGMKAITPPHLIRYQDPNDLTESGITGGIFFSTSHCTLHCYPHPAKRGHVFIDIFSCLNFDVKAALAYVDSTFRPTDRECTLTMRGRDFPRSNDCDTAIDGLNSD